MPISQRMKKLGLRERRRTKLMHITSNKMAKAVKKKISGMMDFLASGIGLAIAGMARKIIPAKTTKRQT
jgi:hypothetical protein